jgi:hypothetical protein
VRCAQQPAPLLLAGSPPRPHLERGERDQLLWHGRALVQLVVAGLQVRQRSEAGQLRRQVVQAVVRHVKVLQRHHAANVAAGERHGSKGGTCRAVQARTPCRHLPCCAHLRHPALQHPRPSHWQLL